MRALHDVAPHALSRRGHGAHRRERRRQVDPRQDPHRHLQPDEGEILVGGPAARLHSPARRLGRRDHRDPPGDGDVRRAVGRREHLHGPHAAAAAASIDWRADARQGARTARPASSADIEPDTPLKDLGVAQKHLVEIARALSHDARVVIMDEPTAALSAHEIDDLFRIVAQLKAEGSAILFISHKFDEIFRIADRWICLRDGEKVGEG